MSKRSDKAAEKFLRKCLNLNPQNRAMLDAPDRAIIALVEAAFLLYEDEWKDCCGGSHHIGEWRYPYHEWGTPVNPSSLPVRISALHNLNQSRYGNSHIGRKRVQKLSRASEPEIIANKFSTGLAQD